MVIQQYSYEYKQEEYMKKFLSILLVIIWGIIILSLEKLDDKIPDTTIWTIGEVFFWIVITLVWIIFIGKLNDCF